MKKDIVIPDASGLSLVFIADKDANQRKIWTVGLKNEREKPLTNLIINAQGHGRIKGKDKQTANVRFLIEFLAVGEIKTFEILVSDSLKLENSYRISFFEDNTLLEKRFDISPGFLSLEKKIKIEPSGKPGVIVK